MSIMYILKDTYSDVELVKIPMLLKCLTNLFVAKNNR